MHKASAFAMQVYTVNSLLALPPTA